MRFVQYLRCYSNKGCQFSLDTVTNKTARICELRLDWFVDADGSWWVTHYNSDI